MIGEIISLEAIDPSIEKEFDDLETAQTCSRVLGTGWRRVKLELKSTITSVHQDHKDINTGQTLWYVLLMQVRLPLKHLRSILLVQAANG